MGERPTLCHWCRADDPEGCERFGASCLDLRWAWDQGETHRLRCEGAFSLNRDPFDLMPAIDAYAEGFISGGKMRECIRRWLAGADFRDPDERDWRDDPVPHEPLVPEDDA